MLLVSAMIAVASALGPVSMGSASADPSLPGGPLQPGGGVTSARTPLPARSERPRQPVAPAHVRMIAGRASLLSPEGTRTLAAGSAHVVPGAASLELGWGDRAELRWPGQGSLKLTGPALLEWAPPWLDGSGLAWRVVDARSVDAEVRRGPVRVEFPSAAWTAVAGAGAFRVESLPAGAVRLENRAGVALEVHAREGALPPGIPAKLRIAQGRSARLKALPPPPPAPAR